MPIWLRKFTFHKIQEHYTKQNQTTSQDSKKTTLVDSQGNVNKDSFKKLSFPNKQK